MASVNAVLRLQKLLGHIQQAGLPAVFRVSKRGVPHLICGSYSISWFDSTKTFRLFDGYGRHAGIQNKLTVAAEADLIRILPLLVSGKASIPSLRSGEPGACPAR